MTSKVLYHVYSARYHADSTVHSMPLNNLEESICTTTITNIRPYRDSNLEAVIKAAWVESRGSRVRLPLWHSIFKEKTFLLPSIVIINIVGNICASNRQGSKLESCISRAVSSYSSHHPQEVLLAQFGPYDVAYNLIHFAKPKCSRPICLLTHK